jgi:F1F0 ATPase subunit 2
MDAGRMSLPSYDELPPWAMLLSLAAHLAVGIMVGTLYFRALWWNTRRLALGGRATTAIALSVGRFVLLGGLLLLASREGALPLLILALGVLLARFVVMRRVREAAP